jgi:hypothetical protein
VAVAAPAWLAPRPKAEEIFESLARHDFGRANDAARRFLATDPSSPTARILFAFGEESRQAPEGLDGAAPRLLAPRGRIFGRSAPILLTVSPVAPPGATPLTRFIVHIEVEGDGGRAVECGLDGRVTPGAGPATFDAAPGAAGRVRVLRQDGSHAGVGEPLGVFAFEAVNPSLHAEIESRLRVVARIANGDAAVEKYLRAMCFAREGCFSNALGELDALLAAFPGDAALRAARGGCAARAAAFPPLTSP